ncbi:hypothetical protein AOQ84DRAFT_400919 [Glonium stellatum]|uniref:Yeast cell wall synthesis Kre9/Knh1-like N-terminal domain-containing protein n=1 Tax=Glonium stellatum TaxID=574774 RepID=A0A8E2EQB8_9PEZI|nr:hypothetical protein AOQ84DRAFT_400919 [Glonium stellatum]
MYSNDFSLFALFTAGLAALTSAYHAPVGNPDGNPTAHPGLNEIVPVGKPYAITWNPTTTGTITILLLRGPSTNVVPLGAPIASGIDNTGTYEWTPPTTLEPDTTHYGIQLIVDATGQYQYSPQFGISNPSYAGASASASSVASSILASITAASTTNSTAPTSTPASASSSTPINTTALTITPYGTASSHFVASTGFAGNSSIVQPTKSMSVPSSLLTSATGAAGSASSAAASATHTGAGGQVRAGLGLVGAVAGLVMVL